MQVTVRPVINRVAFKRDIFCDYSQIRTSIARIAYWQNLFYYMNTQN